MKIKRTSLLHFSYSGTCKLANTFIGAININLEKSSFWQSSMSSSKHESVSTSEKSVSSPLKNFSPDDIEEIFIELNSRKFGFFVLPTSLKTKRMITFLPIWEKQLMFTTKLTINSF